MPCPAGIVSSLGKFIGNTRSEGVFYTLEGKVSEDLNRLEIGSTRTVWSSTKAIAVPHPGWNNPICQQCCKAAWQKQTLRSQWTTIWVSNVPAGHILGGYYQQDSRQMQGSDPSLQFDTWEVTSGVLHPVLGLFKKGIDVVQWVQQRCTKMVRGWSTWCRRGGRKNWTCSALIAEDLQEELVVVSNYQMGGYRDNRAWLLSEVHSNSVRDDGHQMEH